jgi:hypothetical protein
LPGMLTTPPLKICRIGISQRSTSAKHDLTSPPLASLSGVAPQTMLPREKMTPQCHHVRSVRPDPRVSPEVTREDQQSLLSDAFIKVTLQNAAIARQSFRFSLATVSSWVPVMTKWWISWSDNPASGRPPPAEDMTNTTMPGAAALGSLMQEKPREFHYRGRSIDRKPTCRARPSPYMGPDLGRAVAAVSEEVTQAAAAICRF